MRLVFLAFLVAGCGSKTAAPAAAVEPTLVAAEASAPELVPYPYTADEIRDASPAGRQVVFRIYDEDRALWQRMTFASVDETGATIVGSAWSEGTAEPEATPGDSSWDDLQQHAAFPAGLTTVEPGHSVTVPAGTFEATRYTVERDGEVTHFFFAPSLPGPPVLMVAESAGGLRVMEMVASEVVTAP